MRAEGAVDPPQAAGLPVGTGAAAEPKNYFQSVVNGAVAAKHRS